MSDYPTETHRSFGRYQAVESMGHVGLTHLWRAWDPYLERFVVVAVLHGEDPAHVRMRISNLGSALHHWTGGKYRNASQVLDFEPGNEEAKPFIVLTVLDDAQGTENRLADAAPRAGTARRHWDLFAAAGGMLLAGILAWLLSGLFSAPRERPLVRAPEPAPPAAGERHAVAKRTPTVPRVVTSRPSPPAAAAPAALPVRRLVEQWLAEHCRTVEQRYEERGREKWSCSWQDLKISGSLPTVDVEFTRFDRAAGGGSGAALELLERERFRLTCAGDGCRRLAALPQGGRTAAVAPRGEERRPPEPAGRENHPPVVEILAAPRRVVAEERVVLKARVTDPDVSNGDRVECTWSVDGKPVSRLCWELVWTVPSGQSQGKLVFNLEARDRHGARDSELVTVTVEPRRAAAGP